MAQASEQKLWPSRTTAWDACTSQVQRGQAQGVAGAITTNQLTVVWAEKNPSRTNTPFPHTIHAGILITILTPSKTPGQQRGSPNQSKTWIIKTTNRENKYRRKQIDQSYTFLLQDQFISLHTKNQDEKGANTFLQASIKRYAPSAQRKNN